MKLTEEQIKSIKEKIDKLTDSCWGIGDDGTSEFNAWSIEDDILKLVINIIEEL